LVLRAVSYSTGTGVRGMFIIPRNWNLGWKVK
jgi:hypothetical protein